MFLLTKRTRNNYYSKNINFNFIIFLPLLLTYLFLPFSIIFANIHFPLFLLLFLLLLVSPSSFHFSPLFPLHLPSFHTFIIFFTLFHSSQLSLFLSLLFFLPFLNFWSFFFHSLYPPSSLTPFYISILSNNFFLLSFLPVSCLSIFGLYVCIVLISNY